MWGVEEAKPSSTGDGGCAGLIGFAHCLWSFASTTIGVEEVGGVGEAGRAETETGVRRLP